MRAEKGGLVFKPIAKSRVRATSTAPRQASTPAESHGSGAPASDVSTPGVGPMPPPSIIPVRAVDAGVLVSDTPQPIASSSRLPTAAPVLIASGSRTPAPPTIAASPQTIQARSAPAPPVIASSVPTVRAAAPPTIASSAPYAPPAVSGSGSGAFLPETSEDFQFPATLSQLVPPITVSNTASNPDSTVKPRKLRKRKKADTTDGDATEGDKSDEPSTKKPKKKRAKKGATEGTDDGVEKPKKRKKAAKTADDVVEDPDSPVRKRQKKAQTPFDPEADPGEELDPTVVTMADLCDDSGQGRVSSKAAEIQKNHIEWKRQSKEKRARMKALAERKKYGRPEDEEDAEATANANDASAEAAATDAVEDDAGEVVGIAEPSEAAPVIVDESGSGFDYSKDLTASRFTVQVRIGPNGETIIDEESLTVDRAEGEDTANYVHVVESDHTKFVNSLSYTKKCRGSRWSAEETELFFDVSSASFLLHFPLTFF